MFGSHVALVHVDVESARLLQRLEVVEDQLEDEVARLLGEQLTYSLLLCERILEPLWGRVAHT